MSNELIAALPTEVRDAYQESCRGMAPTAMRMAFGLSDPFARSADGGEGDDESVGQFVPTSEGGRLAHKLAEDAMRGWEGIHQAHWSSMADATADKRTAFLRSAQHAKAVLQRVDAAHGAFMEYADQRSAHLGTVLGNACKPPTSYGDAMIDAEVRAMLRSEPNPAKQMAIAQAHPRAVATLPAGIGARLVTESGYAALRRAHLQATVPDALAESDELSRALDVALTANRELGRRARKMIDFDAADKMAKHANWRPAQEAA